MKGVEDGLLNHWLLLELEAQIGPSWSLLPWGGHVIGGEKVMAVGVVWGVSRGGSAWVARSLKSWMA